MIFQVILLAVGITSIFKVKKIITYVYTIVVLGGLFVMSILWTITKPLYIGGKGLNDPFKGKNSSSSLLALAGSSPLKLSYSIPSNTAFNQLLWVTHIAIFSTHSCSLYRIRLALINFNSFTQYIGLSIFCKRPGAGVC